MTYNVHCLEGKPLIVSATRGEAEKLTCDYPVLVTGIGTLAAAISLTRTLERARIEGTLPSVIINTGTAGGLKDGVSGVFEIRQVYKHDFTDDLLEQIDGNPAMNDLLLETSGKLPTARLATGDAFICDSTVRDALASRADLVEMEGYAIARVAFDFHIPVILLKQVSDGADEQSVETWTGAVPEASRQLDEALKTVLSDYFTGAVPLPLREEFRR